MVASDGSQLVLSVLIPVYMRDISRLLKALSLEIVTHGLESHVEIRVADDGSPDRKMAVENRIISAEYPFVFYEDLPRNVGRAAIRNHLGRQACGANFLFLDCDVLPDSDTFLSNYLQAFAMHTALICGGISYRKIQHPRDNEAFYLYVSTRNDVISAVERNENPAKYVLTGNVAIPRSIFLETPFDVSYSGHGYEDTEWAIRLFEKHAILHIDNTVTHLGLIPCAIFVDRTYGATKNLIATASKHPAFFASSQMMRYTQKARFMPRVCSRWLALMFRTVSRWDKLPCAFRYYTFQAMKLFSFMAHFKSA
jgi:glycosyltransferase involved in cell wall biosynthesis